MEMWEFREGLVEGAGGGTIPGGDMVEPWGWRIRDGRRTPSCGALEGTGTCHGEGKRRREVWREPPSSSLELLGGAGGEGASGPRGDEPGGSSPG